jgi:Bacterial extracellular solute-binding proteins, family 5 Middle
MSLAQALDTTRILKQPSPPILPLLADAHAVMMKAGIAEQVNRKDPKFLVGTGRFKYKAHTLGVDSRTKRNPNYWKPGVPHIDGYQAVVIVDLTKIFAPFRARQLTMTRISLHLEKLEAGTLLKDSPDTVVALGPSTGWDSLAMDHGKLPFDDPRCANRRPYPPTISRTSVMCAWSAISPQTSGGIVTRSSIPSFGHKARRLLSKNGLRSSARWSTCSCKICLMTLGFTGNRQWAIGTVALALPSRARGRWLYSYVNSSVPSSVHNRFVLFA